MSLISIARGASGGVRRDSIVRSSEYIPTLLSFQSAFDTSGPVEGKWHLIKRRERDRASSSAISPVCSLVRVCES